MYNKCLFIKTINGHATIPPKILTIIGITNYGVGPQIDSQVLQIKNQEWQL